MKFPLSPFESVQRQNISVFGQASSKADTNTFSEESSNIALYCPYTSHQQAPILSKTFLGLLLALFRSALVVWVFPVTIFITGLTNFLSVWKAPAL